MPVFNIDGLKVNLCGDVHLGKSFRTNVPLHRIGDRESMVWMEFERQLSEPADLTIVMGDLFDKFVVPPEVVLRASGALQGAVSAHQCVAILRGNHDASRDTAKKSSFELLEQLCKGDSRIVFVNDYATLAFDHSATRLHLFGWQPFVSAADTIAARLATYDAKDGVAAFGHWDITQHGEDTHNLIPLERLAELGVTKVFTGHIHKADSFKRNGMEVTVVGSMQPYAHGEEPADSKLYQTLPGSEAADMLIADPEVFANTNVRLLMAPGEEWTSEFNCLSRTFKRTTDAEDGAEATQQVEYATFDLKTLLGTACTTAGVSTGLQARIQNTLMERLGNA